MTKSQLQEQLERTEHAYYKLQNQVNELRNIITMGNIETNTPHCTDESFAIYEHYNELLRKKVEEITGIKIDFCYYTFD